MEGISVKNKKRGDWSRTHGQSGTVLYKVWKTMRQRCMNPNDTNYFRYAGRGIGICERWDKYELFYSDMAPSYKTGLQLDRRDNNKGYSPENCHWVTRSQNMSNRTDSILWNGETAAAASIRLGGDSHMVRSRIKVFNWSYEDAFTTPVHGKYKGKETNRFIHGNMKKPKNFWK